MNARAQNPLVCPICGGALTFEILDDERFLVVWSCVECGLIRATEPAG
jgi:rubrerythrin